ncbi:hypothetical protein B7P43_G07871 [Cryptotermes secundus]|uniref:Uncharacterized protein n=1 Tax=Cryptotermes secundus TaxID=105785 RepID=A0A2J7QJE8_9NEOP|nr:hypothetical protein B7P43_G07871 [Cryptotermes secundus]
MILQSHKANITVSGISRGRPSLSGTQLSRLEVKHSQHWPTKEKQRPLANQRETETSCFSLHKKSRSMLFYCKKGDVALCDVGCFKKCHERQSVS